MGTEFWWFFDILTVSVAVGIFYGAVSKGFKNGFFRFVSLTLAVIIGLFGSRFLAARVYGELFQESICSSLSHALADEEWDVYSAAADAMLISQEDAPSDANALKAVQKKAALSDTPTYKIEYVVAISNAIEAKITPAMNPHSEQRLQEYYKTDLAAFSFRDLLISLDAQDYQAAAAQLEETYYRPGYLQIVRCGLFMLIELVMLIISGIIASMNKKHQDESSSSGDKLLAIPTGIVEAACRLVILTMMIRFLVLLTDSQMLLLNGETIQATHVFRYMYDFLSNF